MMYSLYLSKKNLKELEDIPEPYYSKIKKEIYALEENPFPNGCIKLTNENAYRIRVGNYRIIYEVNENILTISIVKIGHRKDVYK